MLLRNQECKWRIDMGVLCRRRKRQSNCGESAEEAATRESEVKTSQTMLVDTGLFFSVSLDSFVARCDSMTMSVCLMETLIERNREYTFRYLEYERCPYVVCWRPDPIFRRKSRPNPKWKMPNCFFSVSLDSFVARWKSMTTSVFMKETFIERNREYTARYLEHEWCVCVRVVYDVDRPLFRIQRRPNPK